MDDTRKERRADLSRINSVAPSFTNINLDMKQEMDKCRRDLPEVAAYLEGLNSKVDLLIRLLVANASGLPDYPTHEVNLSASGLSFPVQREIAVGTMLEMQLLFFRVIYSLTPSANRYAAYQAANRRAFPFGWRWSSRL